MSATPLLTLPVRDRRDALRGRQRARQIAQLLHFDAREQACIAAGTFLVACQALHCPTPALLCFEIDQRRLGVFLRAAESVALRLSKPIPGEFGLAEADLPWVVGHLEQTVQPELMDEVVKQNEEILTLLHELRQQEVMLEKMGGHLKPSAA